MSTPAARALHLFDEFVTLTPDARTAALAVLARDDPGTHDTLSRLLASDATFESGAPPDLPRFPDARLFGGNHAATEDRLLGRRMGAWRITRLISIGGMGTVHEAQRDDGQYLQRIALKCIRHEMASPRLVEGFLRERDALAALDHPGIAALLDGGVDNDGTPWFAMRYVQGAQIDTWCDERRADLRQRVALLVQVCDALAYAHDHDVLHQDIKPSNVMVTDDGQAKLLDFGLTASLTSPGGAPRLAMSHGYTAPEALSGERPQATADVWSLGRLMYCLLAGMLPRTPSSLLLAFNPEPDAPTMPMSGLASTLPMDAARARGVRAPAQLARRLSGDLDAIALRATATLPADRYASVADLRADLQAWLQSEPVRARGAGVLYRLRRAAARHRPLVVVAAVCLAVLVATGGLAAWHGQRIAHDANEAQALSALFEQTLGVATLSGLGAMPPSSHQLLQDAERRMRAMALEKDHPDVAGRGLAVLARNYMAIGDYARATTLAREAASLQRNDPARTAATLAALLNLQGRPADAGQVAGAALAAADDDMSIHVHLQLLTERARSEWDQVQRVDAQRTLGQALALAERAGDATAQAELRTLRGQWSMRQAHFAEADADLQAAIALSRDRAPLVADGARFVVAQNRMALGHVQEGRALITQVLADYRRQLGDAHPLVGRAWRLLAHADCALGAREACQESLDHAEAIVRRDYGERHPEYADLLRVRALASLFDPDSRVDGTALLRQADAILRAVYPPDHDDVQRVESMLARRLLIVRAPDPGTRRQHVDEAIHMLDTTLSQSRRNQLPLSPLHRITLAEALAERDQPGDIARARRLLDENAQLLHAYAPDFIWRFANQILDARLALRVGDFDRADAQLSLLEATLPQQSASNQRPAWLRQVAVMRARLTLQRGDRPQARAGLERALAQTRAALGPTHPETRALRATLATFDRTGTLASDD